MIDYVNWLIMLMIHESSIYWFHRLDWLSSSPFCPPLLLFSTPISHRLKLRPLQPADSETTETSRLNLMGFGSILILFICVGQLKGAIVC